MTTIHHLPKELIEMISDKLTSTKDLYTGLTVSRLWYACFYRSLYRHIHIHNRRQFRKWLISFPQQQEQQYPPIKHITFGVDKKLPYRPEDYMNGSVPPSSIQMGVTLDELNIILSSLPLLESFYFDARLWSYLNVHHIHISSHLKALPPLDHPRQFVMLTKNLTRLHLQGTDIFSLHPHELLSVFDQTPFLTHLKMENNELWDTKNTMSFSMMDMNALHSKLPLLEEFVMNNVMHLVSSRTIEERPAMRLKKFEIEATTCDSNAWFSYFSKKYPALISLGLNVTPTEKKSGAEEALVTLVKSLDQLKSIAIHHDMGKQFIGDAFLTLISHKKLYDVQLGSTHLVNLPSTQLIGDKLHDLTLSCNRKADFCYPIQSILASCPQLVNLELRFGRIVEHPPKHHRLKKLRMHHVRFGTGTFFHGFSALETLFLRECIYDDKDTFLIDARFSNKLDNIILSELKLAGGLDKLILLKKEEKEMRWYKEMQHPHTFRFYLQRQQLLDVQACHVALKCRSVKSIFFNGCKI